MALTSTNRRTEYLGDAVSTVFAYPFLIYAASDLQVYVDGVLQSALAYTVSGAGVLSGGTVTFATPPPAPADGVSPNVILLSAIPPTQPVDLLDTGKVPVEEVETRALDRLAALHQQVAERFRRTPGFGPASLLKDQVIPEPDGTVQLLAFDAAKVLTLIAAASAGITGVPNPMSDVSDLIVGGTAGAPARLAKGADDTVLSVIAGALGYRLIPTASLADGAVTGVKLASAIRHALHGRGRLTKSGANLLLAPHDGNTLVINSAIETIPDAGVTLAPTGLLANTTYYVYAFMAAGVMTLEAVTTAPATQAGTGVRIKTGDATRTLVGLARVGAVAATFTDTAAQRFVLSYFNRRVVPGANAFAAARTTTSTTYVELSSIERAEFVTWGDEAVQVAVSGGVESTAATGSVVTSVGIDDATAEDVMCNVQPSAVNKQHPLSLTLGVMLAEGYHFATIVGHVIAAETGSWRGGATPGERTTLHVRLRG